MLEIENKYLFWAPQSTMELLEKNKNRKYIQQYYFAIPPEDQYTKEKEVRIRSEIYVNDRHTFGEVRSYYLTEKTDIEDKSKDYLVREEKEVKITKRQLNEYMEKYPDYTVLHKNRVGFFDDHVVFDINIYKDFSGILRELNIGILEIERLQYTNDSNVKFSLKQLTNFISVVDVTNDIEFRSKIISQKGFPFKYAASLLLNNIECPFCRTNYLALTSRDQIICSYNKCLTDFGQPDKLEKNLVDFGKFLEIFR